MRLLVTRPLDESQALAERLEARGHQAAIEPLLTIAPDLLAPLSLEGVQALLFTSANGVRAFALRSPRRDLPVYAVGPATAAAAREIGCATVESAGGDVRALAALVVTRLDPARCFMSRDGSSQATSPACLPRAASWSGAPRSTRPSPRRGFPPRPMTRSPTACLTACCYSRPAARRPSPR
jgi:uroporphyrinogen-III synthase